MDVTEASNTVNGTEKMNREWLFTIPHYQRATGNQMRWKESKWLLGSDVEDTWDFLKILKFTRLNEGNQDSKKITSEK